MLLWFGRLAHRGAFFRASPSLLSKSSDFFSLHQRFNMSTETRPRTLELTEVEIKLRRLLLDVATHIDRTHPGKCASPWPVPTASTMISDSSNPVGD